MAKTALTQLQDQVEAIRREAFAAGYAAAMQAIREFVARPAAGAEPVAVRPRRGAAAAAAPPAAAAPRRPRGEVKAPQRTRRSSGPRPQRGTNARFVAEVLQANAPHAMPPAEIRSVIRRDKGVEIAFTSIRHALRQLEARQVAEQVVDGKTWRHRGGTAASD